MENYESWLPPIFWNPSLSYFFLCKYIANCEDYDTVLYAILQFFLLNDMHTYRQAFWLIVLSLFLQHFKTRLFLIYMHMYLPNVYFHVIQIKTFNSYVYAYIICKSKKTCLTTMTVNILFCSICCSNFWLRYSLFYAKIALKCPSILQVQSKDGSL